MSLILAYFGRGLTRDLTIQDTAGDAITPGENDEIRITIGREMEDSVLVVASNAPTPNGSTFTKGVTNRMRLDASDLMFEPGTYSLWLDYYDNANQKEWSNVERQVFVLEAS